MPVIDYQRLFEHSPNPYMLLDRNLCYVAANAAYLQVTASRWEDLAGKNLFDAFPDDPDDPNRPSRRMLRASLERVLREGKPDTLALIPYKVPRGTPDGPRLEERYWSATHTPIRDARGEVAFILQHTVDVTEVQRLKTAARKVEQWEALAPEAQSQALEAGVLERADRVQRTNLNLESERRHLRRLFEQAPGFIAFLRGSEHVFELANTTYYQLVGHRDVIGKRVADALPEVIEQGFIALLDRVYSTGEPYVGRQVRIMLQQAPDAGLEERFVDFIFQPIVEPDGTVSGIFVQGHEVTEQVHAQEELARHRSHLEELVVERTRALEESQAALRQAQKMEAVGKLTGGVAHDFNNLLQVVGGNLELLQRDLVGEPRRLARVRHALTALERGARLTSQLLAFARRQPLEPTVVNPGRLLRNMDDLLRRALGERIHLETVVGGGLWNTQADPNQLENALLNLAINARDAMRGEGKLTIEAGNAMLDDHYAAINGEVTPGQYVMIAVSDTGAGMAAEVLERAFEPFYTTKGDGQGTGLGLSMVYGFVKQSGGHIKIYSEVEYGTTVKLYLPRCLEVETPPPERPVGAVEGGSETILVVEDDPQVRETAVEMLSGLGYQVLKANDGQSALTILQSGLPIDLLFTDVVMPGPVRSPELAQRARALLPDIDVLFTSGYTENAIVHGGRLDPGVKLLSKPYRRDELARKIGHILRNRQQRLAMRAAFPASQPPVSPSETSSLRVLFVEDDADIRNGVAEFMRLLGHRVVDVPSAEAALEVLDGQAFDVLFTDVSLPGASGLDLTRAALARSPALQVVIASGYGELDLGADAQRWRVLPKPYEFAGVEEVLGALVRRRAT